ncbi:hypothetical protein ACQ27_gp406 [Klebsiella phage K64-1]|nr:hypothetical protein ACQ27_gp406 [Klebsiella phage K64-1]
MDENDSHLLLQMIIDCIYEWFSFADDNDSYSKLIFPIFSISPPSA